MTRITPETAPAGARLLIRDRDFHYEPLIEITVLEWSPTAAAIKVRYASGSESWDDKLPVYGALVDTLTPKSQRVDTIIHGIRRLEEIEAGRALERKVEVERSLSEDE